MKFFLLNIFLELIPPTRFFGLKRVLLRLLGVEVGKETSVCGRVKFYGGGNVSIGSKSWVGIQTEFHTAVGTTIRIGDRCDIAPAVMFVCGSHEIGGQNRRAGPGKSTSIGVGSGVWIGARCTVLGGAMLNDSSVFAAGSLIISRDYTSNGLFAGHPARRVRDLHVLKSGQYHEK